MNKPNEENKDFGIVADIDAGPLGEDQAKPETTLKAITGTMADHGFTPEQLPELWQQAMEPSGHLSAERQQAWNDGIKAMYSRCETYTQHTKIAIIQSAMPYSARSQTGWTAAQAHKLLQQATPEQIRQSLAYEQQHPGSCWQGSDYILTWANIGQLTGPVIEQLEWNIKLAVWTTAPGDGTTTRGRGRHISEHIQQQLLEGNDNAWNMFLGIVGPGTRIGAAAALAIAVELKNRPVRQET